LKNIFENNFLLFDHLVDSCFCEHLIQLTCFYMILNHSYYNPQDYYEKLKSIDLVIESTNFHFIILLFIIPLFAPHICTHVQCTYIHISIFSPVHSGSRAHNKCAFQTYYIKDRNSLHKSDHPI